MLLSYDHRFIFIHVYRTAGTSIRSALQPFSHRPQKTFVRRALKKLRIEPARTVLPHRYRDFYRHIRANDLKKELPEDLYHSWFKFAFVRNPWDMQVSMYHYILSNPKHYFYRDVSRLGSFEEYIEWVVKNYLKMQKDFVADERGNVLVDFVGRFENLEQDFREVCRRIGIAADLPRANATRHQDYRSYYNSRAQGLIHDYYRDDVEFFGYSFDEPKPVVALSTAGN